ncbi:hypothetical protein ULMA_19060 [Patiriisocius marinus]|uniref:Uncharacterized protein n=2 Tax=Patiriisocius marinus TaxID=1397112 RepID=A0A5J4J1C4_9FLAO|nr:hypothetical protein ULMA_19060 [Patiriisocius marinus]
MLIIQPNHKWNQQLRAHNKKTKTMKKLLFILIALTLIACGEDDENEPQIVNIFNGDLTITIQEEVDNFAYTEIKTPEGCSQ